MLQRQFSVGKVFFAIPLLLQNLIYYSFGNTRCLCTLSYFSCYSLLRENNTKDEWQTNCCSQLEIVFMAGIRVVCTCA